MSLGQQLVALGRAAEENRTEVNDNGISMNVEWEEQTATLTTK